MRILLTALAGAAFILSTPLTAFAGQNTYPVAHAANAAPTLGASNLVAATIAGRGPSYELAFVPDWRPDTRTVRLSAATVGGRGPSYDIKVTREPNATLASR